ncbi:MAG: hypothetical protein WDN26_10200 [Chitinophagaceae bacterium]
MQFEKHHMVGQDYSWDKEGDSSFSGEPTRRLFDRFNGNQVLFIINFYGSLSGAFTLHDAREVEQKILNHLPLDAKSEISVFNWINKAMLLEQPNN